MRLTHTMIKVAASPPADEIQGMQMRAMLAGVYAHARGRRNRHAPLPPMPASGVPKLTMRAARAADRADKRAERLALLAAKARERLAPF